jgi:hypothetical protein
MTAKPVDKERLHGLDAVRASALLLGIWLHASMSFWAPPGVCGSPDPRVTARKRTPSFELIRRIHLISESRSFDPKEAPHQCS